MIQAFISVLAPLIAAGAVGAIGLTLWCLYQTQHSLLRIYGPLALIRWLIEGERSKLKQYTEGPRDGVPFSLSKRSEVYAASKGRPVTESFGTTAQLHKPGALLIQSAPFGLMEQENPAYKFCVQIRDFTLRFPVTLSGTRFGSVNGVWIRAASDGNALLGKDNGNGFLQNTGDAGVTPHHLSVCEENQIILDEWNKRARGVGHTYQLRFDQTQDARGNSFSVPLDLTQGEIRDDGRYRAYTQSSSSAPIGKSERGRSLVLQIGSCLGNVGNPPWPTTIDWNWLNTLCSSPDIVGIELKLSIGASPNGEGVWENLTQEQQIVRGAAPGVSVKVPARFLCIPSDATMHQQIDHFLDLVHQIKRLHNVARRKLFLGVKCAFSNDEFFVALANKLRIIKRFDTNSDATIDYIHIDGAEGGTVAGHPSMTDKVGLPGFHSIRRVRQIFDAAGIDTKLALSGRLITPADVCIALALGADWVLTARGAMLATGCIQARVCSSGECPTGITTNDPWRLRGVIPEQKSVRLFRYFLALREGVAMIARSAGLKFRPNQRTFTDKHLVLVQPLPLNDFLARPPEQAKKGTLMQAVGILVPVCEDEKQLIVTINRKETPHVPDLPVGLPGPDEDLKTAALRELWEETGCVATIIDTSPFEDIDPVDGTHVTIFLGHFVSQDETKANRTEGVPTRSTYDALARFGKYHKFNQKCLAFFQEKL